MKRPWLPLFLLVGLAGAAAARAAPHPRIIPQSGHAGPISAAAWTADSRFVVTGGGDRQVIVWDTAGHVVDRARVRTPPGATMAYVESIAVAPDGGGVTIVEPYYTTDFNHPRAIKAVWRFGEDATGDPAETEVPARIQRLSADDRRSEIEFASVSGPWATDPNATEADQLKKQSTFWPMSPDKRWQLRTNVDVLTIRPASAPLSGAVHAVALVGQANFSDFVLSDMAGNETDATRAAYGHADELRAAADREMGGADAAPKAHWASSPSGRQLAWIDTRTADVGGGKVTLKGYVHAFDLTRAGYTASIAVDPNYDVLHWIDAATIVVTSRATADPPLWLDLVGGRIARKSPPLCFAAPLGRDGAVIGAGTASCEPTGCYPKADAPEGQGTTPDDEAECAAALAVGPKQGLWVIAADGARRALDTSAFPPAARGEVVSWTEVGVEPDTWSARFTGLVASPSSALVAATFRDGKLGAKSTVGIWEVASGRLLSRIAVDGGVFAGRLFIARTPEGGVAAFDPRGGVKVRDYGGRGDKVQDFMVSASTGVLLVRLESGSVRRYDVAKGADAGVAFDAPVTPEADVFDDGSLFWTSPGLGQWEVRSSLDGALRFTLFTLPGSEFIVVTPEGRYDSNMPADARAVRWQVTDAPLRSLGPQAFMRQTYTPRLMARLLDCSKIGSAGCGSVFKPLGDLASLDRVLPEVRVVSATTDRAGLTASVVVEARSVTDIEAPNGVTGSGLHDLRLFRDGKLVVRSPGGPEAPFTTPEAWRSETAVKDPPSPAGWVRKTFTVALPTEAPRAPVTFSAYAFNADRIKGDTSTLVLRPAPGAAAAPPRPRRAYVIAVGVDETEEADWRLRFAAADARAITSALSAMPGRRVAALALTSTPGHPLATRDTLHDVFRILADGDASAKARLRSLGLPVQHLQAVTPDDVLIFTFSGHGWADRDGAFYLAPAGGHRLKNTLNPDPSSFISAADLTEWLRNVDAGDAAVIIDACQSAASVNAGDFKPGPMGDPGLGQLAFDKGIRVLAAAQADEEAQEDPALGQGLLTYALVRDGLQAKRAAELRLDAWLKEGAGRLPSLRPAQPRTVGHVLLSVDDDERNPVQEPALFDFTGKPSAVVLRQAAAQP